MNPTHGIKDVGLGQNRKISASEATAQEKIVMAACSASIT